MSRNTSAKTRRALVDFFDVIDGKKSDNKNSGNLHAQRMAAAWVYSKSLATANKGTHAAVVSVARWAPAERPFQFNELDAFQMLIDARRAVGAK